LEALNASVHLEKFFPLSSALVSSASESANFFRSNWRLELTVFKVGFCRTWLEFFVLGISWPHKINILLTIVPSVLIISSKELTDRELSGGFERAA
jgi:hypothetical protein